MSSPPTFRDAPIVALDDTVRLEPHVLSPATDRQPPTSTDALALADDPSCAIELTDTGPHSTLEPTTVIALTEPQVIRPAVDEDEPSRT